MATNAARDLLALCRVTGVSWHFLAREAQRANGVDELLAGRVTEATPEAERSLELIVSARQEIDRHREWVDRLLGELSSEGASVTTVLGDDYPANLRVIDNLPPFLIYRGRLAAADAYSVAVVGTRRASEEGKNEARELAAGLAEAGVTVMSGLARGIDTAAHEATLEAAGRTIAVIGTGIRRTYPRENAELADRIAETGAVVSQFWPDMPPTSYSFPWRNAVMSGMAQGTVVVEASATSGAKMQVRIALLHGKRVFLVSRLVTQSPWARRYLEQGRRGAIEVAGVADILAALKSSEAVQAQSEQRRQLALAL